MHQCVSRHRLFLESSRWIVWRVGREEEANKCQVRLTKEVLHIYKKSTKWWLRTHTHTHTQSSVHRQRKKKDECSSGEPITFQTVEGWPRVDSKPLMTGRWRTLAALTLKAPCVSHWPHEMATEESEMTWCHLFKPVWSLIIQLPHPQRLHMIRLVRGCTKTEWTTFFTRCGPVIARNNSCKPLLLFKILNLST